MTWYKKSENLRGESHDEESSYLWSAVLGIGSVSYTHLTLPTN